MEEEGKIEVEKKLERRRRRRDRRLWKMIAETLGQERTKINVGENKTADKVKVAKEKQAKNKVEKK
jgi:hypothetical protein